MKSELLGRCSNVVREKHAVDCFANIYWFASVPLFQINYVVVFGAKRESLSGSNMFCETACEVVEFVISSKLCLIIPCKFSYFSDTILNVL